MVMMLGFMLIYLFAVPDLLVMRYSGLFLDYYVVSYVCEYSVQNFYGKKRPEKNIVAGRSSNLVRADGVNRGCAMLYTI